MWGGCLMLFAVKAAVPLFYRNVKTTVIVIHDPKRLFHTEEHGMTNDYKKCGHWQYQPFGDKPAPCANDFEAQTTVLPWSQHTLEIRLHGCAAGGCCYSDLPKCRWVEKALIKQGFIAFYRNGGERLVLIEEATPWEPTRVWRECNGYSVYVLPPCCRRIVCQQCGDKYLTERHAECQFTVDCNFWRYCNYITGAEVTLCGDERCETMFHKEVERCRRQREYPRMIERRRYVREERALKEAAQRLREVKEFLRAP